MKTRDAMPAHTPPRGSTFLDPAMFRGPLPRANMGTRPGPQRHHLLQFPVADIPNIDDDGMSSVPEETAVAPSGAVTTPSTPFYDLAYVRSNFPFLPIMEFPHDVVSRALVALTATDLPVPDNATIGYLSATNTRDGGSTSLFASLHGNAVIGADGTLGFTDNMGFWIFLPGIRAISVMSTQDDVIVSLACYTQRDIPAVRR